MNVDTAPSAISIGEEVDDTQGRGEKHVHQGLKVYMVHIVKKQKEVSKSDYQVALYRMASVKKRGLFSRKKKQTYCEI